MKTLDYIPTGKQVTGTMTFYGMSSEEAQIKYYGEKQSHRASEGKKVQASIDIYDSLKRLKGSALKVAQMLSMEKNLLPKAYVDQFSLSQFSVPPLSAPLVRKLIRKYFGADPESILD